MWSIVAAVCTQVASSIIWYYSNYDLLWYSHTGICLSAKKEDIVKYIVYYLEANLHLLDKVSEKVSLSISEHTSTFLFFYILSVWQTYWNNHVYNWPRESQLQETLSLAWYCSFQGTYYHSWNKLPWENQESISRKSTKNFPSRLQPRETLHGWTHQRQDYCFWS